MLRILPFLFLLAISSCATIGLQNPGKFEAMDFGEPVTLRLCVLKDRDINQERVDELIGAISEEYGQYRIEVEVPWVKIWDRPGFWSKTIMYDVITIPLTDQCDRLFVFVSRNALDFLWGIIMPEYVGMVEGTTYTKGFAIAEWGSLNQLLPPFHGPKDVVIHESYHLLGCEHSLIMNECYDHIKHLKNVAIQSRAEGGDFFATITKEGKVLKTQNEVENELYQMVIKQLSSK